MIESFVFLLMIVGTDLLSFDSLPTTGVHWQSLSDMIANLANCQQNTRFYSNALHIT